MFCGAAKEGISKGWPQASQRGACKDSNDARHSSQIGTRLARVNNRSQMRQSDGKMTLTRASLASASHLPAHCRATKRSAMRRKPILFAFDSQAKKIRRSGCYRLTIRLEESLLRLLLAANAVLGPRHGFQPLLLHFFLAISA